MISSVSSSSHASQYAGLSGLSSPASGTRSASTDENPLKALFEKIDSDGDGSLSKAEVTSALSSSDDADGTEVDVDKLMSLLDSDDGGTVSENEFATAFAPPAGGPGGAGAPPPPPSGSSDESDSNADSLISALDTDGNGVIDSQELAAATESGSVDSDALFTALDADGNGAVDKSELSSALQASAPPPPPARRVLGAATRHPCRPVRSSPAWRRWHWASIARSAATPRPKAATRCCRRWRDVGMKVRR